MSDTAETLPPASPPTCGRSPAFAGQAPAAGEDEASLVNATTLIQGREAVTEKPASTRSASDETVRATPGQMPQGAGAARAANPSARVSFVFGRRIAQGGMGAILEADDRRLGRKIAAKVMLLEQDASEDMRQRFIQEAAVLARLAHPNIVPVYDLGHDSEGQLYYTMKLVRGRTLQDVIDNLRHEHPEDLRDFTLERLLTIFLKVCDALSFAHSKGIIHRDLKPENVMVGEFGEVLLMDWGLAKLLNDECPMTNVEVGNTDDRPAAPEAPPSSFDIRHSSFSGASHTIQGSVLGTPKFMSPEQALGLIDELDQRSDIFSLGGILYAILTLRPPVDGKTVQEVLTKVCNADITPPTAFGTSRSGDTPREKGVVPDARKIRPLPHIPAGRVPFALSAVAMKALSQAKEKRYQDVKAFAADIEAYQQGFATEAEHARLAKQLLLLIKRNKGVFATAAAWLVITAMVVGFIFHLRASEREMRLLAEVATKQEKIAKSEAARATKAEAAAVLEKTAARRSLAQTSISLADAALREGDAPEMQAALNDVPADLQDSTWRYLLAQSDTSMARLRTRVDGIRDVAAHPKLPGVFVVADYSRKITVLEVRSGIRLLEFDAGFSNNPAGTSFRLTVSPDGERVAIGRTDSTGGILIYSLRDGKKLLEWEAPATRDLAFSPDGSLLLQNHCYGASVSAWESNSGQLRWRYEPAGKYVVGVLNGNGSQVLVCSGAEGRSLLKAADGSLIRKVSSGKPGITSMALWKDNLYAFSHAGTVEVRDLRDDHLVCRWKSKGDVLRIAWTPDGSQVVTLGRSLNNRQILELHDPQTGAVLRSLIGGSAAGDSLSIHPLSLELAVNGVNPRVWDLTPPPAKWQLKNRTFSPGFWGSDDVIMSVTGTLPAEALRLGDESSTPLWKAPSLDNRSAVMSADGRLLVLGEHAPSTAVRTWWRRDGKIEEGAAIPTPGGKVRPSPAGEHLAVFGRGEFRQFDVATARELPKLERPSFKNVNDAAWLPGGRQLLALVTVKADRLQPESMEKVILWDSATGKILQSQVHHSPMDVLAVSPDGTLFAEAGVDRRVRIRDAATLEVKQEFRAHDSFITAIAWHPSRPLLATASADLTIRLWDLSTGQRLEEFRGDESTPQQLVFSPGGRLLFCLFRSGFVRVWEPASLLDRASPEPAPGGWKDLLAGLTPERVQQIGHGWRLQDAALLSPDQKFATLPLPGDLSGVSYQVYLKMRRSEGKEMFHLVLPVGERLTGLDLDGNGGKFSRLTVVNGNSNSLVPGITGAQVTDTLPHDLEVTVRLDGEQAKILATLDNRSLFEWSGPVNALSQHNSWTTTPPGALALGTVAAGWTVEEVKVK